MSHKYFTVEEMTKSSTAVKLGIDNKPTQEILKHLNELMDYLDIIREAWGSAIIVTSGYRCPELNAAVGGSPTSVHVYGWAVDMHPANGKNKEFLTFLINFFKTNNMAWDQILNEHPKNGVPSWIHLGIRNRKGQQRKQVLVIN